MRKYYAFLLSFVSCGILPALSSFSQSGYTYNPKGNGDKYFVSLGYGQGAAHWSSDFRGTEFYDKDGRVINSGDMTFKANSPTTHYDVSVQAPLGHIRMGLGISFEEHYLAQLKVYTKTGEEYLLFDEGLRFDKVYLNTEIPFKYNSKKPYSFNWNIKLGWFGYSNINRFNFIGDQPFAVAIYGGTGVTADYELYPRVYFFLSPNIEYKYYNNTHSDGPVQIIHRVFTAFLMGGIRVDLGKLKTG